MTTSDDQIKRFHALLAELDRVAREMARQTAIPIQVQASNRPKLTKREVSEIRSLKRSGASQAELADIFDVAPSTISRIIRGFYHR